MSSVEMMVSEIQTVFEGLLQAVSKLRNQKTISENDILQFLSRATAFQRKLEYYKESISVFSGRPYFERTLDRFQEIISYCQTEKKLHSELFSLREEYTYYYSGNYWDDAEGVIYETKQMLDRARHNSMSAVHRSLRYIDDLLHQEIQTTLVELYGDLRLLANLTIFPIEERLKVKGQLVDGGFKQVAEYLEIAEENYGLTPPHLKDTLSNCRLALESTITILSDGLSIKSTQRFSVDLGSLQNSGFIDRETKDVVLSVWSYLSMKGSHSYSTVDKKSLSDVDFGLEQTYRVIAQLLTKYENRNKNKAPA